MKCPNCKQQLVSQKDFCINCGQELKTNFKGISIKWVIAIMVFLVLVGVIVVLAIMYYGTDRELDRYLNDEPENKEPTGD